MTYFFLFWYGVGALQWLFWGLLFMRLAFYKPVIATAKHYPPVSLIVCARNEAVNLQKNLEYLLQQDYPTFEVIVVDDVSEDATLSILNAFRQKYSHLHIVHLVQKKTAGKKGALGEGIAAAQYQHLLLTDADCRPASNQWIRRMADQAVVQNKALILGYGPYWPAHSWLNRWVQFETAFVLLQYAAMALWKQPYMGVGRNLWYEKALFEQAGGFEAHAHLISGDDDLLVNQVATGVNTGLCLHPESFVYSEAPSTWNALYHQKTRHYSSSGHYKWSHQLLLGLLSMTQFFFYVGLLGIIVTNAWNYAIIVMVIGRIMLFLFVYYRLLHLLQQRNLLPYVVLLDALLPLYYIIFAGAAIGAARPSTWKGQ
ncbi:MAG: glycosyltransferase [Aureispira sp.]